MNLPAPNCDALVRTKSYKERVQEMRMGTGINMIIGLIVLTLIAIVFGVCEDDLVPLETGQLPAEWNVGTIPQLFINSEHLRGVISSRDLKILGLDTITASLQFCPGNMTIYGNLTARRIQIIAGYTSNLDYLNKGSQIFGLGDGKANLTVVNVRLRNLVAPLRYSRTTKRLQMEDVKYEAIEEHQNTILTGCQTMDGENGHVISNDEFVTIDRSNANPTFFEVFKAIINYKVQKGILMGAAKQMFASAMSP